LDNKMDEFLETENRSETDPYPSDLDGAGCNQNAKTCPVAPVMVPRPDTAKWISFLSMFDSYNIKMFIIKRKTRWTK
jgi:hypothetical protein